jgi:CBS domain-containing protein
LEVDEMLERLLAATVGDLDLRDTVIVTPNTSIGDTIQALRTAHRGAALVEDEQGKLLGIFTERDVLSKLDPKAPPLTAPVSTVMSRHPASVAVDATVGAALAKMAEGQFRHLPVVRRGDHIVGQVSVRDILTWVSLHYPEAVQNLPPEPSNGSSRPWGG